MIWDDSGFLLSKNKYSENSLIVEVFTKNYGKNSELFMVELQKKKIIYKLVMNYILIIIQSQ